SVLVGDVPPAACEDGVARLAREKADFARHSDGRAIATDLCRTASQARKRARAAGNHPCGVTGNVRGLCETPPLLKQPAHVVRSHPLARSDVATDPFDDQVDLASQTPGRDWAGLIQLVLRPPRWDRERKPRTPP